jgi:hypothetical protein
MLARLLVSEIHAVMAISSEFMMRIAMCFDVDLTWNYSAQYKD